MSAYKERGSMRFTGLVNMLVLMCNGAFAQSAAVSEFEVASVKRVSIKPGEGINYQQSSPGRLTLHNATLGYCIRYAYDIQPYQIAGPAWIDRPTDVLYDIVAKASSPARDNRMKLMLRTLLRERLNLRHHFEKRNLSIYALVVLSTGLKQNLRKSAGSGDGQIKAAGPYSVKGENVPIQRLAELLSPPWASRPVLDMTGLDGTFDFALDLGRYILDGRSDVAVRDSSGRIDMEGAILRGLPEQLGLNLEGRRALCDVLVIDNADKSPTSN